MDYEKAVIYDRDISFPVNGKEFTVKPLPFKYIVNGEFQNSGLIFPKDMENVGHFQKENLLDETRRNELNKWMTRLLSLQGSPVGLEQACEFDWDITDIGRFLSLVMQTSGMTTDKNPKTEDKTEENIEWMEFIAFIQSKGNMRWDEILSAPLLRLNSFHSKLLKIVIEDRTSSMGSGLMCMLNGGGKSQEPQEDPRFGKTPQFDSREEYFNFVNKQTT